jgi:inosine/xanthosine triphosphate pyrophosphatase family protein
MSNDEQINNDMNRIIKKIYFATGNKDKVKDFQLVFDKFGIKLVQLQQEIKVDENASDLLENAEKKALAYSRRNPSKVIMATDGGVIIPFLGDNWNHVLTKRLSGIDNQEEFTERQRAETLLDLMKEAKGDKRRIYWQEAVVLALKGEVIFEFCERGASGILSDHIPNDFDETGYWLSYLWFDPQIEKHYMAMNEEEKLISSPLKRKLQQRLIEFFKNLENSL